MRLHSVHPTGGAESISGNGVCVYVCMTYIVCIVCMYVRHHFK